MVIEFQSRNSCSFASLEIQFQADDVLLYLAQVTRPYDWPCSEKKLRRRTARSRPKIGFGLVSDAAMLVNQRGINQQSQH
jgi:hypothetical protein